MEEEKSKYTVKEIEDIVMSKYPATRSLQRYYNTKFLALSIARKVKEEGVVKQIIERYDNRTMILSDEISSESAAELFFGKISVVLLEELSCWYGGTDIQQRNIFIYAVNGMMNDSVKFFSHI